MNEIGNSIIKSINTILNERLTGLKYDKTFKATVWGKNEDGTYRIAYLGQIYNVHNSLGTELKSGQSVWIKIPSGIFRNMHICGIDNKKSKTN